MAMKANGNSIGRITDLITSFLGEGRTDLPDRLALKLQASLGFLKHGAEPDEDVIREIRKQVTTARWLKCKRPHRVSELQLA